MTDSLTGKWALVTGSSRGIGQQVALGLAQHGCNVVVHARKLASTEATLALLAPTGVETLAAAGDLATADGIAAVVAAVKDGPGHVDILYNNAAVSLPGHPLWEIPPEDWVLTFKVNVFAMVELCRALVPAMVAQNWGRVVNVTSGIKDQPNLAAYSVSKAAVDKYTQDLAFELRGTNVLASYLDPGWLQTDMGGPDAPGSVESVLPGALVPVLLPDDGPNGQHFRAQAYTE